jgi:carbonic anhydrase/acetyltransferase-like protein (isoleucine patch superfamily)
MIRKSSVSTTQALRHLKVKPHISEAGFIARSADVMGNVRLGKRSSIWFNCVLRSDINEITVGEDSNIQDGTVVHVLLKVDLVVIL